MSVHIIILGQPHQISRKKRTYLSPQKNQARFFFLVGAPPPPPPPPKGPFSEWLMIHYGRMYNYGSYKI